jgi:hypothetical protein
MAAPTVTNVTLHPADGWVQLSPTTITTFVRISKFPNHLPIYLTWAASKPTGTPQGGYRMDTCDTHFDGAATGLLFGRVQNNANGTARVSTYVN